MNKKAVLFLLLFTPLLMANSPAPMPNEDIYEDLACHITQKDETKYTIDVYNLGEEFAGFCNGMFAGIINDNYIYSSQANVTGYLFNHEMIIPGGNKVLEMEIIDSNYSFTPQQKNTINGWYLTVIDEEVTFENIKIIKSTANLYKVNYEMYNKSDYYYASILEVTYKGKDYAIYNDIGNDYIETNEELDLNQLQIKKMTAYRSYYSKYKYRPNVIAIVLPIFIFIFFFLFILGIPAAIIIPTTIARCKRNRNKDEAK